MSLDSVRNKWLDGAACTVYSLISPKNGSDYAFVPAVLHDPRHRNVFFPPVLVVHTTTAPLDITYPPSYKFLNRTTTDGPVLSQTDVYLLGATLVVNPLLLQLSNSSHHIQFNIQSGASSLIDAANPGDLQDVTAEHYDQPAVLPRCTILHIITRHSPWCLTVENEQGVTVRDLLGHLYTFYGELITEPEWTSLSAHHQHLIKRAQGVGMSGLQSPGGFQYLPQNPSMIRAHRRDWLLEKAFLEELHVDDEYANNRLGFKAPNVFVMELTR